MKSAQLFRKKRAFSLIELIMTIVVVGIVALPISITLAKHVQSVFVSQDYNMALNLARFEMDKTLNTAYASIAIGTVVSNSYQGYAYDLTSTISYAYGTAVSAESVKLVVISVTKHGSATVLVTLKNYIAKNISWGL